MIKIIGMVLVMSCCTLLGINLSFYLSKRVTLLEQSLSAINAISDELKYTLSPPASIIHKLAKRDCFKELLYLKKCSDLIYTGERFDYAWKKAVLAFKQTLQKDDLDILLEVGDILGTSDVNSQLTCLHYTKELMIDRLESARDEKKQKGTIYRTMGALGGLAIAILFI